MTWAQMGCTPAETTRRMEACERMNKLWRKRNSTDDKAKQKRLEREIDRIRRAEAPWLKNIAFWLY